MGRVVRRPGVLADLEHIWLESAKRYGGTHADMVVRLIEEKFEFLAEFRVMGRPRPSLGSAMRSYPVGRYPFIIYFEPIDSGVEIFAVLHGRQLADETVEGR